jgi:glycosyltransferase involved in cell wall biosynthesis
MKKIQRAYRGTRPRVFTAIAAYNNGLFVRDIVLRARKYSDGVIVANDASHDNTSKAAEDAGAMVVNHTVNQGYGVSIRDCFEVAKANRADIVVTLDGDNQHFPEEIPLLVAPIINGEAEFVIGSRFMGGHTNMPRYRKIGIYIINWLFNIGSSQKITDSQCGFKAYSRKVVDEFPITEPRMGASVEIPIKIRAKGIRIKEVSVSCSYHSDGSSLNPIWHALGVICVAVKFRLLVEWQKLQHKSLCGQSLLLKFGGRK